MQTVDDQALQAALFADKVARARAMSAGDKLFCGVRLFDLVRLRMLAGIRGQHPDWSDREVEAEFRRRLSLVRQLDEQRTYTPCGSL
ncbi:MAG: hypothetical protein ACO3NZ_13455 [Pirellulales bacterium]|jgi:hypothetical protein